MNDFDYDCLQKKRIAKCAKNHVNARRGKCKLPYEYLSAKERNALNGEVKTYNLKAPMSWEQLNGLPRDLKQEYLTWLQQTFHANDTMLGEMWGVSHRTAAWYRKAAGVTSLGRGAGARPSAEQLAAWNAWLHEEEQPETPVAEPVKDVEPAIDHPLVSATDINVPATVGGFRVQLNNVHSWEELYALIKQFPFPERRAAWVSVEVQ